MIKARIFACLFILCAALIISEKVVLAADYYVDVAKGNDSNPGTLTKPWKSTAKANSSLYAGDTVHIRAGTYIDTIEPSRSGSKNKYITYQRHIEDPEWSVKLTTKSYGAYIDQKNYVKIKGIYFERSGYRWVQLIGSNYCIIQNCKFFNSQAYSGINIDIHSDFNKIENCIFPDAALMERGKVWDSNCQAAWKNQEATPSHCDRETAPADFIRIHSGGNILSGNVFGNSSHSNIADFSKSTKGNVYRFNVFENLYHRGFEKIYTNGRALFENNTVLNTGNYKKRNPSYRDRELKNGAGVKIQSSTCIVRKNIIKNSNIGLLFGGTVNNISNDSRFYNNTFYNNSIHILQSGNSTVDYNNNIFLNNIFYNDQNSRKLKDIRGFEKSLDDFIFWYNIADYNSGKNTKNRFINNTFFPPVDAFYFKSTKSSPKNLNTIIEQYPQEWDSSNFHVSPIFEYPAENNFSLNKSSELISAGNWLTVITSPMGNSKNDFLVMDAKYFSDGWGIEKEFGDVIMTESGALTKIKSIDYSTNKISVEPAINVVTGEGVALQFSGKAPDLGAIETNNGVLQKVTGIMITNH